MPPIKPTDLEQKRRIVRACVTSKMELNGWDKKRMATKCRVDVQTLRSRMETPEKFSLGELWNMGIVVYIYDGQSRLPTEDGLVELK